MAFVNEWVSAEDVKNYSLDSVWMKVHRSTPITYAWTIDRDRNIFFFNFENGREEFSNHLMFALSWNEEIYVAGLIREDLDEPGCVKATKWQLIGIDCPPTSTHSKEEVSDMLKEVLREYRRAGIVWSIESHRAIFCF